MSKETAVHRRAMETVTPTVLYLQNIACLLGEFDGMMTGALRSQ